jgi:hypothetical protein
VRARTCLRACVSAASRRPRDGARCCCSCVRRRRRRRRDDDVETTNTGSSCLLAAPPSLPHCFTTGLGVRTDTSRDATCRVSRIAQVPVCSLPRPRPEVSPSPIRTDTPPHTYYYVCAAAVVESHEPGRPGRFLLVTVESWTVWSFSFFLKRGPSPRSSHQWVVFIFNAYASRIDTYSSNSTGVTRHDANDVHRPSPTTSGRDRPRGRSRPANGV